MAVAGEEVFLGREGTGAATIFGSPVNVWGQVFARQRQQGQDAAAQRKAQIELTKFRDKKIKEYEENLTKLGKPYDMHAEYIQNKVNELQARTVEALNQGEDIDVVNSFNRNDVNEVRRKIARSQMTGTLFTNTKEAIKRDPYMDEAWGSQYINDKLFPTDDPDDSDIDAVKNIAAHPRIFNGENFLSDFANQIKETTFTNAGDIQNSALGLYRDITTQQIKFYKGVDANGKPIPGVSDAVIDQAIAKDERVADRFLWDYVAETKGLDPRLDRDQVDLEFAKISENPPVDAVQYVRKRIENALLAKQKNIEKFSSQRLGQFTRKGAGSGVTEDDLLQRDEIISSLQQPFGALGEQDEIQPETQQLAKSLIGGKIGNDPIADVEVVRAGAKSQLKGDTKDFDRYVFKLDQGKEFGVGKFGLVEQDLSKGDYGFWNTILNTTPGNKKIDIGKLTKENAAKKGKKTEEGVFD